MATANNVRALSVQKTERLEIRVTAALKSDMQRFCHDHGLDMTFFVTTLIRQHLKQKGYLITTDTRPHYRWTGDAREMPAHVDPADPRWVLERGTS